MLRRRAQAGQAQLPESLREQLERKCGIAIDDLMKKDGLWWAHVPKLGWTRTSDLLKG
jgi:hypothetical protein